MHRWMYRLERKCSRLWKAQLLICLNYFICFNNCIIIIIIIMTHRQLWSVAMALRDVHLLCTLPHLFPCSWLLFHRQSAVFMSFEDHQEVFASSYLSSSQLSLQWLASRLGVQVHCCPVWLCARYSAWHFLSTMSVMFGRPVVSAMSTFFTDYIKCNVHIHVTHAHWTT